MNRHTLHASNLNCSTFTLDEPSDEELRDIQQMLARYYADKAHAAMDDFLATSGVPPEERFLQPLALSLV